MSRLLLWVTNALLGIAAAFMTSFLAPATLPLPTVAVIVMVKADRVIAVSGLMIGFGGSWLLLLANQLSSGGVPNRTIAWVVGGSVPLMIGSLLLVLAVAREHRGKRLAAR